MAVRRNAGARAVRRDVAPLGIEGDAWDVALAVLFLASDEARFINCEWSPSMVVRWRSVQSPLMLLRPEAASADRHPRRSRQRR
jgi:hypothetical protein